MRTIPKTTETFVAGCAGEEKRRAVCMIGGSRRRLEGLAALFFWGFLCEEGWGNMGNG